jgi:hypothetical protein
MVRGRISMFGSAWVDIAEALLISHCGDGELAPENTYIDGNNSVEQGKGR